MFVWLNKQGVRATTGYILQRIDRFHYHYTTGDHVMEIVVEPGIKLEFIAAESTRQWLPPFDLEEVTELDQQEIQRRVSNALNFMGIKHKYE